MPGGLARMKSFDMVSFCVNIGFLKISLQVLLGHLLDSFDVHRPSKNDV